MSLIVAREGIALVLMRLMGEHLRARRRLTLEGGLLDHK